MPDIIPEGRHPDPPVAGVFGTELVAEEESPALAASEPEHRVLVRGKGSIGLLKLGRKQPEDETAEGSVSI